MFHGFPVLDGGNYPLTFLIQTSSLIPKDSDNLPTGRIYGPTGFLSGQNLTASKLDTGSITAASNTTPIVITAPSHGLTDGVAIQVSGVAGNTGANGLWKITRVNANQFSLDNSVGSGAYTSGGTWHVSGLYQFTIDPSTSNGYETGAYMMLVNYEIGGTEQAQEIHFQVT